MTCFRPNEFAKLAFSKEDKVRTCEAFRRLDGPVAFEPAVWNHVAEFNANRDFALNVACKSPEIAPTN